jgi:hypothetical protein
VSKPSPIVTVHNLIDREPEKVTATLPLILSYLFYLHERQSQLASLSFKMGERKIINKYIPPDFDPALVPRGKKLSSKDGTVPVRMMLPFSMQCNFCHDFLYRGRKYNSRKEPMGGPDGNYLGITRLRFHIKCNQCSRPVTFLTDPKNADYEVESGATRNYEIQRDKAQQEEKDATEKEVTSKLDPMKALEDRVLDSQREMADQDNLEEIKAMNARHVQLMKDGGPLGMTEGQDDQKEPPPTALTEEDEALVKSIQFGKNTKIYRLDDSDEALLETKRQQELAAFETQAQRSQEARASQKNASTNNRPAALVRIKRKAKVPATEPVRKEAKKADLSSLLGGYGSSSSSE